MATQTIISHNDVETNRHEYIGASDIGTIMGVNPFKTPFELWCEKTQKIKPKNLDDNDSVRMGKVLEEFVAQEYAYRHNCKVRRAPIVYVHPDYPFLKAHADRLITGSEKGLECKTTSEFNKDKWKDADIPESYILQCQFLMGLAKRNEWDIAVLIGGNKYKDKPLKFDKDLFDLCVEKAVHFWNYNVGQNIPPELTEDDDETLKTLYSNHNEKFIELFPNDEKSTEAVMDFESAVANLQEMKMHKDNLEKDIKVEEAKIKDIIKDNVGIKTPKYVITWKTQNRSGIDTKLLKEEKPQIAKEYETVTSYRVMRITKNKECEVA